ncbi:unnamed protein product, partial [Trichobilharzia regenti]
MAASTKPDLDRLGYFRELSYHTIGDPYVDLGKFVFNQSSGRGKQMYGVYAKTKSGLNDGYFGVYNRPFIGEAYTDMTKVKHQERLKEKTKERPTVFLPPSGSKPLIGSGNYWGTFSNPIPHFSNESISSAKHSSEKNFYTSQTKKGSGARKQPGGYKAGTFNPFPTYISEPYVDPCKRLPSKRESKVFIPSSGFKSARFESILTKNVYK